MAELTESVLRKLRVIVGDRNVLSTSGAMRGFAIDWTGRYVGQAAAVLRPRSTDEVARLLMLLSAEEIPVIPQGGNTGQVGGGVPLHGEVVLSLTGLDNLGPVDPESAQVTAEAGVTLATLRERPRRHGLTFGVDIASRGSATIGGAIATNAGGLRMIRYGDTAAQVLGVEAVLADGSVISHLGGLDKDNTGYRLHQLLAGSEGTLAVITKARLRLVPYFAERVVALVALPDIASAVRLAGVLRRFVPPVEAVELFLHEGVELIRQHLGLPQPFQTSFPVYVLVEAADHTDPTDTVVAALADADPDKVLLATTAVDRERLWRYREFHTEAISRAGTPRKLDVSLPLAGYAEFAAAIPGLLRELSPTAIPIRFGHIADGSLH
ncbi:MAG: FAD-binding oxidoreductase, partial [Mycobacteriales bacterium]